MRHPIIACRICVCVLAAGMFVPAVADHHEKPTLTVDDARRFMEEAEQELLELWIATERAAWVKSNFITEDTEAIAAAELEKLMARTADLAYGASAAVALFFTPMNPAPFIYFQF